MSGPDNKKDFVRISGNATAWSRALSEIFVDLEVEQLQESQKLRAKIYRYPFGDLTFIRVVTRGGAHTVRRTESLIRKSDENVFFLGFLLAGNATLMQDNHQAELRRGDIAILDSSRSYLIDITNNLDALWVSVPRHRLEGRMHFRADIMAHRIDGSSGVGHVAASMLRAALDEAPQMASNEANRIANHLLDLLSLSLMEKNVIQRNDRSTAYSSSLLRNIQEHIEQNLDEAELTPAKLAKSYNVSVRYINKLFAREGISVARWIRIRRLESCRMDIEQIENTCRSISDIAYSHGFGNISSFNRAFKSHFGLCPRALRNDMKQ